MLPVKDTQPSRHVPFMTVTLIAVNVGLFLHQRLLPSGEQTRFLYAYALRPDAYVHLQNYFTAFVPQLVMPLVTSMFLHGGWLHLGMNMLFLWIFGDNVEDRLGGFRFLLFYLSCGIIANLVHIVANIESTVPLVGASGAIAGVLGAYFLRFPRSRIKVLFPLFGFYPLFFHVPALLFLGLWFAIQVHHGATGGGTAGGVAWWAHIGGFVAGMALLSRFEPSRAIRGYGSRSAR